MTNSILILKTTIYLANVNMDSEKNIQRNLKKTCSELTDKSHGLMDKGKIPIGIFLDLDSTI